MAIEVKIRDAEVIICKDGNELADASARQFLAVMREAIAQRGIASVALSGGRTPQILYKRALEDDLCGQVDWTKVHFFVGDERCVPQESSESNFGNAFRLFLSKLSLPAANLHPVKDPHLDAQHSALVYEKELESFFGLTRGSLPRFDMIHLGMGPDGHCASLFPGTEALTEKQRLVVVNHVDKLNANRITFTFPVINNAGCVMFMMEGGEKSAVLADALLMTDKVYPVQYVQPVAGSLCWFVDEAAASALKVKM